MTPDVLLRFVHITDTHYAPADYRGSYTSKHPIPGIHRLIEHVNALPYTPDFILHTGDVAYDPYPDLYPAVRNIFSELKAPVYYVPGNHDHNQALQATLMGRDEIQVPLYHTMAVNDVRLLFLDSNGTVEPPAGEVSSEQVAWLQAQVQADDPRPIIIAVHHPMLPTHDSEWYDTFMRTVNGEAVHEVLRPAASKIRGVFFGHVHQHIEMLVDGILYSAAPSSWLQFHTWPRQNIDTIQAEEQLAGFCTVTITTLGTTIQRFRI